MSAVMLRPNPRIFPHAEFTHMQQGLPPEIAGIIGIVIAVACGVLVIALIVAIFYLLTLQKALSRVSPHNRKMEPAWSGCR